MTDEYVDGVESSENLYSGGAETDIEVAEVPSWLQLGVIVSDGSGSMRLNLPDLDESLEGMPSKTKAEAAASATRAFLDRMNAGGKKQQFTLGWIAFSDRATIKHAPMAVDELRSKGSFDPTAGGSGGTQIWAGLEAAAEMVAKWQASPRYPDTPMTAVVVLLTDGEDGNPARTLEAAEKLKTLPHTRLCGCFFATKGTPSKGAEFLRRIVSEPESENFTLVYDAEALRNFFHASITAVD
jgi:hypothetical protein